MCIGNHSSFGHPEPSNALVARDDGWRPQRKMLITILLWYIWYTIIPHRHKKVQKNLYGYLLLVGGIPTPLKNMSSSVGMIIPNIWRKKKHVPNHQPDWLFIGYWYRICFSILCIVVPLNPNGPPLGIPRSYLQWDPLRWLGAPNFPASAANARAGMVASKPIGTAGDLPSSNWTGLTGFVIHIITNKLAWNIKRKRNNICNISNQQNVSKSHWVYIFHAPLLLILMDAYGPSVSPFPYITIIRIMIDIYIYMCVCVFHFYFYIKTLG